MYGSVRRALFICQKLVAIILFALILAAFVHGQTGIPSGPGWHQLSSTAMTSVCLGTVPNAEFTDTTMTTTTSYDFNCNEVVPWSGAVADDVHQQLILWGGGHSDYQGNEVLALHLNSKPTWELYTRPTTPVPFVWDGLNWEGLAPYFVRAVDGGKYQAGATPASRHTYNGIQYVPYQNKMYSFGGAVADSGFLSSEVWTLDLNARSWTLVGPPYSQSPGYPTTAYNPANGHIVMHDKSWTLSDYDPHTNTWQVLTTAYHVDDGTTAAIDPVNNQMIFVGASGTANNMGYPAVPTTQTVQAFSLTAPYAMQTWTNTGCDLLYRSGGLAWDSALGLMVGYPGGGNQAYLLNTGSTSVTTSYGTVGSHKCLDITISTASNPVKGVDYPADPEGTSTGANLGIYGRFQYFPSLDAFVVVNDRTQNVWGLRLSGGTAGAGFVLSASPTSLSVAPGASTAAVVTTAAVNGFNNSVSLSASGAPAGTTISFSPSAIAAPGSGTSTMSISVGANTAAGTYPISVSATGSSVTHVITLNLTVTGSAPSASFTLSASPSSVTVQQGSAGTSTATTALTGGFNSTIAVSVSGAPTGTTVTLSQNQISAPGAGSTKATFTVGSNTATGTYPITISATGGGVTQAATVSLTISAAAAAEFTISSSPGSASCVTGESCSVAINTTAINNFAGSVALSASGTPTGTTAAFSPTAVSAGNDSVMTLAVGSSTNAGTYPITVTGTNGSVTKTTNVSLAVASAAAWQEGFDFRNTAAFISDPGATNAVLPTMAYPTKVNGASFGWAKTSLVSGRDRSTQVDPRLAGINFAVNGSPATFYVDLPSAGTYKVSLAMGDESYQQCWVGCQIELIDGSTVLATISSGNVPLGSFIDAGDNTWSASAWPGNSVSRQITLVGKKLTVKIGTAKNTGDFTPIAYLGVTQVSTAPTFTLAASPTKISVAQGGSGTSTVSTVVVNGFSSAISLSTSGAPAGTTVSLSSTSLPAPGAGTSTLTVNVPSTVATGSYPIKITAAGVGLTKTYSVTLCVTSAAQPSFTLAATPSTESIVQGSSGTATLTTTVNNGFSSAVTLTASGAPSGTTVSLSPTSLGSPGAGSSTMKVTVGANTAAGTYPIAVTASGGGVTHTATVNLQVSSSAPAGFTLALAPSAANVAQASTSTATVSTAATNGFNSAVSLSASGAPSGTSISFSPSSVAAPGSGSSTMTITVPASASAGSYPVTVSASGSGVTQTAAFNLTISAPGSPTGNGITITDLSGGGQTNRPVSVPRFFKQGDIPHFAQAVIGGTPVLTQCDVKNRWPDESLKFAIVSFIAPSVSTAGTQVTFQDQSTGNNTGYLQEADMLASGYNFDATMQLAGTTSQTISARAMLQAGFFRYWLQGPIVTAVIVEDRDARSFDRNIDGATGNPLHPIYEAWFYPQNKSTEVGFTIENSWASSTATNSARNQTYALTLSTGNSSPVVQLSQLSFTQFAFTRWRRSFWIGKAPGSVQYNWNPQYLLATGAYPNFDTSVLPNSTALAAEYAGYAGLNPLAKTIPGYDPGSQNGSIVNYAQAMNATGDPPTNSWIGTAPTWDIDYLLTGDDRMRQMMIDNADLAARFPMWYREADHNAGSGRYFDQPTTGSVDTYGRVISINARQLVTLMQSQWSGTTSSVGCYPTSDVPDSINVVAAPNTGNWLSTDTSHIPEFGYMAYTLTGKYYYLEQLQMQAAYHAGYIMGCNDGVSLHRYGHLGLIQYAGRDTAWALRTMAYAAFVSPDDTPEGPYFASKIANNIAMLEGEHGLPQTISGNADVNTAYNFGVNGDYWSQASNPSTLGFWRAQECRGGSPNCYVSTDNNVNPATIATATAPWMDAFVHVELGMIRQFGIVDTTSLLQFAAKRYFHTLLDPAVNHYLIEQYVYPTELLSTKNWIQNWTDFQNGYVTPPTAWDAGSGVLRGDMQMSALSFMTNLTVDGYSGQSAFNYLYSHRPYYSQCASASPRWCIKPLN